MLAALFCLLTVLLTPPQQGLGASESGHVITGHVVDPEKLRPEDAMLTLGRQDGDSLSSTPVPVGADGSFVTPRLSPDTYVLSLVRSPHSIIKPPTVVGLSIVSVGAADVSGATVLVRRDTAITGSFRMESDNPRAEWPPMIVVNAYLALDGRRMMEGTTADGAPAGKFVLRNAFGPRVLRCGYTLARGSWWMPSRVTLDGVDITNVPTDFSAHENGRLDIVFTQRPTLVTGMVVDAGGQPVRAPWIVLTSADRALWQHWATTTDVAQGNTRGRFSVPVRPGRYLVSAVPQTTFNSWKAAREQILRFAPGGAAVQVGDREVKTVSLTLQR